MMHSVSRTDGPVGRKLGWKGTSTDLDVVSKAELRRRRQGEVEREWAERAEERHRQQIERAFAVLRERLVVTYGQMPDLTCLRPQSLSIDSILRTTAGVFGFHPQALKSAVRRQSLVRARHTAMWLCCRFAEGHLGEPPSLPQIGKHFGGKDHTTILHARDRIDRIIKENSLDGGGSFKAWLKQLAALPPEAWKRAITPSERRAHEVMGRAA